MKKLVVEYKGKVYKIHATKDNTTIVDSYQIKKYEDMKQFLLKARTALSKDYSIKKRSLNSMIREWRVHNLLYSFGILKERTGSVDLNIGQPWYIKALYFILSPLYLNFL